jgi:UDPglucose 6-dehydrogenase
MKIAVIGTGYVGLVTGTCFAEVGNDVVCVDNNKDKVEQMKRGEVPIFEPDLDKLFERNTKEGRLTFTTDLQSGIDGAEVIFLALPTPPGGDGSADLSYVLGVADDLGQILTDYAVIVDKSTVPVGTAEKVSERMAKNAKVDFDVVSNPEFLREGFAVADFMKPDRVVVGASSERAFEVMRKLYEPFARQYHSLMEMDTASAEMTKYAANAFLAMKISYMNQIAALCEELGADVDHVRRGIGADDRIGKRFLFPGIGYGGSCFPKDVKALLHTAKSSGLNFEILEAVETVNAKQKQLLPERIKKYYKNNLKGKRFALWGLAFKPDTDDIREAASLEIINSLTEAGAIIVAYDPEAKANVEKLMGNEPGLSFVEDRYAALKDADALIIATEWREFSAVDFGKVKSLMKAPVIFDGRNMYELKDIAGQGVYYSSIGRKVVEK